MTAKTLLVVSPYFPPEGGGVEIYVANLTRQLSASGWRIVVVTTGPHHLGVRTETVDTVVVYRLGHHARLSNTRFALTWRRHLAGIIRFERPDLINAHLPVPGLADLVAGVSHGVPLVVTYHTGSMRKGRWAPDALIYGYERVLRPRLLRRADWIISSSDFVRDSYLTRWRTKCSTVSPGVDIGRFIPAGSRPNDRLLFVGALHRGAKHKGLDDLLMALPELRLRRPDLRLDVVGEGNDLPRYQSVSAELGIGTAVRFTGRLDGPELARAYAGATALALPTRNDSLPIVLLEAMASGLPVVSTTVGGIPSMITDGVEGFLVPAGNLDALIGRLGAVLDDPALGDRLGRAGRATVERSYTWAAKAAATDFVFDAVLSGRPAERMASHPQPPSA